MQTKDTGDWLSAQQAVQPDGTELSNLPLINKKLPPLVQQQSEVPVISSIQENSSEFPAST
ncbi:hypothetical protein [Undibacterium flavidum]|uniref:Uncharacterized protein n=1 Tax=Undibacterium flavidum TaxID=2762297 RepID=A0ABR6Y943_9BURK|nr:hypothetical protein [Undibacterium flavidum]MBC3873130.1 hypothetical protein [Undibacterium flavidum]